MIDRLGCGKMDVVAVISMRGERREVVLIGGGKGGLAITWNVIGANNTNNSHRNTTMVAAISTRAVVGAPRSQQA